MCSQKDGRSPKGISFHRGCRGVRPGMGPSRGAARPQSPTLSGSKKGTLGVPYESPRNRRCSPIAGTHIPGFCTPRFVPEKCRIRDPLTLLINKGRKMPARLNRRRYREAVAALNGMSRPRGCWARSLRRPSGMLKSRCGMERMQPLIPPYLRF